MTPAEQAAAVYQREACARSFKNDLAAHLVTGYVISTPDVFVMARPVDRWADPELIVDPFHQFSREESDCWHVYLCAGDWRAALAFLPYDLAWMSWERSNRLRFRELRGLRQKVESALAKRAAGK